MNQYILNSKKFGWGPGLVQTNPEKIKLLQRFLVGKVIDIGCGSGVYTNLAASLGHKSLGVDNENSFIKAAKKDFPQIQFIKASAYKLPCRRNSFSTAIMFDILEHLDDARALKEALTVAERVIISVPLVNEEILLRYGLSHAHYLDHTHQRTYTIKDLRDLFKKMKLKTIYLSPALPLSLSGLLIHQLSYGRPIKRVILKSLLKPFLPEPPLYSTIFAVVEL